MVMVMQPIKKLFITLIVGLVVLSCGSGEQQAGIDRGGVTSGSVTGLGSVWLNGERYVTSSALITVNGQDANEDELAIGQVVVVRSRLADDEVTLVAETVSYESNLQGPVAVDSVDLLAGSFIALGQLIYINSATTFGPNIVPADLSGLSSGDIVEVSGFVNTFGAIQATRIELEDNPDYSPQLSGVVSDLNEGVDFKIGDQLVDYSEAVLIDGFIPAGIISEGDKVRVVGSELLAGTLVADTVVYRGTVAATEDGDDGEIEGLISVFVDQFSFTLAGFDVVTNAQTEYSGGTAADLDNNIRIEAEGLFDTSGTLIADNIEFRDEGDTKIEATVDEVNAANVVTVFGITVETTSLTKIEDKNGEMRNYQDLGFLNPGDYLVINGSWVDDDGGRVIATKLERTGGEDKIELGGVLTSVNNPNFSLLGIIVQTDAGTDFEVDAATFFADAEACVSDSDCLVEAAWPISGPYDYAVEVELED
jgi:hypothetical protein